MSSASQPFRRVPRNMYSGRRAMATTMKRDRRRLREMSADRERRLVYRDLDRRALVTTRDGDRARARAFASRKGGRVPVSARHDGPYGGRPFHVEPVDFVPVPVVCHALEAHGLPGPQADAGRLEDACPADSGEALELLNHGTVGSHDVRVAADSVEDLCSRVLDRLPHRRRQEAVELNDVV